MEKGDIINNLKYLSEIYQSLQGPRLEVVICGGAALNLLNLISRATKDVDLVAPPVLPESLKEAAEVTAKKFDLPNNWINQGSLDLYTMGLQDGFFDRCKKISFDQNLTFLITSRYDQIHFKLYASIDRGGYHVDDLKKLQPTTKELVNASQWMFTHDVSEAFFQIALDFLEKQGGHDVAEKIRK